MIMISNFNDSHYIALTYTLFGMSSYLGGRHLRMGVASFRSASLTSFRQWERRISIVCSM